MTTDRDKLTLTTGGYEYSGWEAVSVTRTLEEACSSFSLALTEDVDAAGDAIRPRPGDECTIDIGSSRVVTGYVDAVTMAHDGTSHTLEVTGRSKTQDLVDCSIVTEPFQYRNRTMTDIATVLAAPYHVTVTDEEGIENTIPRFVCETGETPFDAIERLARDQAVLVTDNEYGELVLTTVGQLELPPLAHPGNILSARLTADASQRYSHYTVKAQTVGDDDNFADVVAGIDALIEDDDLRRYRALVIRGERAMSAAAAKKRAVWEAVTRAGRSAQVEIAVQGWRGPDNVLWEVNGLTWVTDAVIGVDAVLLTIAVTYSYDSSGQRTTMLLAPPGAYLPEPPKEQKKRTGKKITSGVLGAGGGVMGLLARAVVRLVDAAKKMQSLQVTRYAGEVLDDVEHFEPYGFTSHPSSGAEALVLPVGGSSDHTVALVVADRRYRVTGLEEGEVCIHDDQGQTITLTRTGIEVSTDKNITLDATGSLSASGASVAVSGPTSVDGTLASTGALSAPSATVSGGLSAGSLTVGGAPGLTGTFTFAALTPGDVTSMTFVGGALTAVTVMP